MVGTDETSLKLSYLALHPQVQLNLPVSMIEVANRLHQSVMCIKCLDAHSRCWEMFKCIQAKCRRLTMIPQGKTS